RRIMVDGFLRHRAREGRAMRKAAFYALAFCFLGTWTATAGQTPEKIHTIKIVPDPAFGQGVAWDSIFRKETDVSLAFLPDGSFFLGCGREAKVYKFDAAGKIVSSFGRKGQGPGDLTEKGAPRSKGSKPA
ncbi:MAG: hypothetical protein PHI34_06875, partial [Acidobacteriota bacterium]|nr:hypothetical protein [Acidobacteriota bacterium]